MWCRNGIFASEEDKLDEAPRWIRLCSAHYLRCRRCALRCCGCFGADVIVFSITALVLSIFLFNFTFVADVSIKNPPNPVRKQPDVVLLRRVRRRVDPHVHPRRRSSPFDLERLLKQWFYDHSVLYLFMLKFLPIVIRCTPLTSHSAHLKYQLWTSLVDKSPIYKLVYHKFFLFLFFKSIITV